MSRLVVTRKMRRCEEPLTWELIDAMAENSPRVVHEGREATSGREGPKPRAVDLFRKVSPGMTIALPNGSSCRIVGNTSTGVTIQSGGRRLTIPWEQVAAGIAGGQR